MNLSQKIKKLRTEKMMTQKELAGVEITRNMLSQIENGTAMPSLSTIIYLAGKLGVPAGYLLSEGDEEFIYNKSGVMRNIKRAYSDGNFELCREMCLTSFDEYDDELELILTDCCLGVAENCMRNGKLHRVCSYLDETVFHAKKTLYNTVTQENRVIVMYWFLKEISPALDSNEIDIDIAPDIMHPSLFHDVFSKYITAIFNIENFDLIEKNYGCGKNTAQYDGLFIDHLKAKRYISRGDYKGAARVLKSLMNSPIPPERLLWYLICSDIELCCKELGDYKGAYEFSNHKMEVLEHMLVEN